MGVSGMGILQKIIIGNCAALANAIPLPTIRKDASHTDALRDDVLHKEKPMAGKTFNRQNALTVICATILVGTEILAAALALGWAVGGLTGWGQEVTTGLILVSLAGGIYLCWIFVKAALKAEPIHE